MRLCTRSALALLLVFLSASGALAQTVNTVRVELPQQAGAVMRNLAGVLARQVAQRCDASVVVDGEAPLTVELAIAPGIGTEGFRIEDRPGGGVKIIGNDTRGLFYGVGKLLRTSRYDRGGFDAGAWRGTSIPEKPVRGIYFATHFHNFYHDAPIDEVQRYVEDVGLWGLNTLIVWYDMHHFSGFDSPEAVDFRKRLKARDLMVQADARLTPRARQAWRWRILFLRAQVDAQLYLNRGVMQGRVLHDAFQELTRIYHAKNAEPAVKPPQVDPAEPPITVRSADFHGPELAEAYVRAVLSSKPTAYWRMGDVAGNVLEDASGNSHSAAADTGVAFLQPTGPIPANPAAVLWGGRISAAIEHLTDAYSVELWVRNDLPPTARPITAYFFSRGVDGPAGGDEIAAHYAASQPQPHMPLVR